MLLDVGDLAFSRYLNSCAMLVAAGCPLHLSYSYLILSAGLAVLEMIAQTILRQSVQKRAN